MLIHAEKHPAMLTTQYKNKIKPQSDLVPGTRIHSLTWQMLKPTVVVDNSHNLTLSLLQNRFSGRIGASWGRFIQTCLEFSIIYRGKAQSLTLHIVL